MAEKSKEKKAVREDKKVEELTDMIKKEAEDFIHKGALAAVIMKKTGVKKSAAYNKINFLLDCGVLIDGAGDTVCLSAMDEPIDGE